ncbi:hypothetical protein [Roseibium album]|uniref:hypothetical protein n=1 Tax=Roseibium album TaxID=311410 RepID=UPI00391D6A33
MFRISGVKMQDHSACFGRIRGLSAISPAVTGKQGDVASVRTEPEGKAQPRRKSPSGYVADQKSRDTDREAHVSVTSQEPREANCNPSKQSVCSPRPGINIKPVIPGWVFSQRVSAVTVGR